MSVVETALKRPYTVVAMLILISLMGIGAALRMPIDIFTEIDIPVVAVVWTYNGMSAEDIQNRILTLHERQLASLVDDISRIEAVSYEGVGVEKVYLHEGADVTRAVSQLASSALVVLKYMPPNITPPLVLRYGATDVPIIQLSLSSKSLPDTKLNDLGQNIIRPALAVVHGAEVPYPYGGKPRVIMADLDSQALEARGLSPTDVSTALQRQNVILPAGDVKIGDKDYTLAMNNSPDVIESINAFPIKQVDGRTVFMRDVAHVHDGFQVQTNSVSVNGTPGALMTIRKTGGVSTLAVINGVRAALTDIKKVLPKDVTINALFDQSLFVKAALNSVVLSACMAAGLTALVIIMFLGNVRLSVIILASIPLSIITAVLFMNVAGQTLNTLTLGGFALAIGILVDNGTVVIENIERHVAMGEPLYQSIVVGANEVAIPTFLSTLCICIVFVPVFLLQGTAKYLFSPLSLSVMGSLLASLALSFTMVPVLFNQLMRRSVTEFASEGGHGPAGGGIASKNFLVRFQARFEHGFEKFRENYRNVLSWALSQPRLTVTAFAAMIVVSMLLFPALGRDFFPQVDAGQMRLHVRAPPGTRLERTQQYFAEVEEQIRKLVGNDQIDVMLDNIGLPYSGINIALSDSATVGPMDGEILISLNEKHTPTAKIIAMLRRELPARFAELQFFFQPADIVDQVLNFGQPAPIDVRISGPDQDAAVAKAAHIARAQTRVLACIPGTQCAGADRGHGSRPGDADGGVATGSGQQRAGRHQFKRANGAEFLGGPAQQCELSAGGADSALSNQFVAGPPDDARDVAGRCGGRAIVAESGILWPRGGAHGHFAAEHSPGIRRARGRPGARSVRRVPRYRRGVEGATPGSVERHDGDLERTGRDHARELHRSVHGHRTCHHSGVLVSGDELPELDRSADRDHGGSVRPGRSAVDALPVADPDERAGSDGHAHVHRFDHSEQHFGGQFRQSTRGGRRRRPALGHQRGLYAAAAGAHDRRGDDRRHGAHGVRHRRGRRTERTARPGGDRRSDVRDFCDSDLRAHHVLPAAPPARPSH
jgi:multidrug efflux pump subunit AcrB